MATTVMPVPKGYHTLQPVLRLDDAKAAIEFYKKAFGATQRGDVMYSPDGEHVWHAELALGDTVLMVSDTFAQEKSTSASFYMYVNDVDAVFARATTAGAKETMKLEDTFWGDRLGQVEDPFGNKWSLATHVEDVTEDEMKKRAE